MDKIVYRLDDIGASTKLYNQRGKVWWNVLGMNLPIAFFANWGFFKRIKPFKLWGPYPELNVTQWEKILALLKKYNVKMTVGVTACWATSEDELIPFDKKFPKQAAILKEAQDEELIEIANHGLTHCVLIDNKFYPKMFGSNRKYHREFWDWLPDSYHKKHIEKSQDILTKIFKRDIVTFIPPGNVWSPVTEKYARAAGIKFLSSLEQKAPTGKVSNGLKYVGTRNIFDFHDRDIVIKGIDWLENKIAGGKNRLVFVREFFN